MTTAFWMTFRSIWSDDSSQCRTWLRRSNLISDALACLHWLRVPARIEFKIAVLTYKVVRGLASGYVGPFTRVADLPSQRSLRSVGTNRLVVPISIRLSTVGSRAFPVAVQQIWNTWHQQNHWPHFVASSIHTCSGSLFLTRLLAGHQLTDLAVVLLLEPPTMFDWLID